jgi:hypothetical protein
MRSIKQKGERKRDLNYLDDDGMARAILVTVKPLIAHKLKELPHKLREP